MKAFILKNFAGSAIRLVVLSVLILGMASVCQAQASAAPAQPTTKATVTATAPGMVAPVAVAPEAQPAAQTGQATTSGPPAAKGTQEGIKVHGHWTIEVKNPDGTLVTHREFENALYLLGAQVIGQLLSNTYVQGSWIVYLCQSGGSQSCETATNPPILLEFIQAGSSIATNGNCVSGTNGCSNSLIVSAGNSATTVSLTGSIASSYKSGTIDTVSSMMAQCASTAAQSVLQSTCFTTAGNVAGSQIYPFTNAFLTQTVPVTVGQSVAVTVTFSFQ